jgi:hypothetical protein
VLVMQAQML